MVKNEMQAQNGRMEARTKWLSKVLEVLMEVIGDTFSKYLFETALISQSFLFMVFYQQKVNIMKFLSNLF